MTDQRLIAPATATGTAVDTVARAWTFDDLRADTLGLRAKVAPGARASLRSDDAGVVAAAMSALDGWASEVHLLPGDAAVDASGTVRIDVERSGSVTPETAADEHTTDWILYTSGTTGTAKPVRHTGVSLARRVATTLRAAELRWGLLYDPNRMAGTQVLLQSLLSGAYLAAPPLDAPLRERVRMLVESKVNALSATPTLWRMMLRLPSLELRLRQITLGGEIADQPTLDALRARFPDARIVHIFAATETGAVFSVTDGRAGFPIDYLDDAAAGVSLAVRDGVLHVYRPGAAEADGDGFIATGDVVERVGDRMVFCGRASGVINVGGANVSPEAVERMLRTHPAVADVVVKARPNSVTGNVLVADVVPSSDAEPATLTKELRAHVRGQAPRTHVPASITFVPALEVAATGKAER
ncbi:MAG: class I adenylate-forming enzyme family protein [Actinomycetota bacterium]